MASVAYNSFKGNLFNATYTGGIGAIANAKMMLLDDTSTTPDNTNHDFVSDIVASEFTDTNYTGGFNGAGRKALTNRAVTTDTVNNRAELDFDDITWTALGGTQTVVFAIEIREITNDAATNLWGAHDIANTLTNGTDFTLQVGSEGAIHLT